MDSRQSSRGSQHLLEDRRNQQEGEVRDHLHQERHGAGVEAADHLEVSVDH